MSKKTPTFFDMEEYLIAFFIQRCHLKKNYLFYLKQNEHFLRTEMIYIKLSY